MKKINPSNSKLTSSIKPKNIPTKTEQAAKRTLIARTINLAKKEKRKI